jgi:hypothetical protein
MEHGSRRADRGRGRCATPSCWWRSPSNDRTLGGGTVCMVILMVPPVASTRHFISRSCISRSTCEHSCRQACARRCSCPAPCQLVCLSTRPRPEGPFTACQNTSPDRHVVTGQKRGRLERRACARSSYHCGASGDARDCARLNSAKPLAAV